jgi:hypothetical protein
MSARKMFNSQTNCLVFMIYCTLKLRRHHLILIHIKSIGLVVSGRKPNKHEVRRAALLLHPSRITSEITRDGTHDSLLRSQPLNRLIQRCTAPWCQAALATEYCRTPPCISGSTVHYSTFHVTFLAPGALRSVLDLVENLCTAARLELEGGGRCIRRRRDPG